MCVQILISFFILKRVIHFSGLYCSLLIKPFIIWIFFKYTASLLPQLFKPQQTLNFGLTRSKMDIIFSQLKKVTNRLQLRQIMRRRVYPKLNVAGQSEHHCTSLRNLLRTNFVRKNLGSIQIGKMIKYWKKIGHPEEKSSTIP